MPTLHSASPLRPWRLLPLSGTWRMLQLLLAAALLLAGLAPAWAQGSAKGAPTPPPAQVQPPAGSNFIAPVGLVRVADGRLLAPEIARIVTRGELVVAMLNARTPPFFYFDDDGEWTGLEVHLAQQIAKELGVKLRVNREAGSFNAVVGELAAGKADMAVSKLSRTLPRAQVISFSHPYLTLKHALLLNRVKFAQFSRGRPLTEVIRKFDGSLGVIANSSFADFARTHFPKAKIVTYMDWNQVLAAVMNGDVVAAYRDEFEVKRVLKSDPTMSLVLRTVTLNDLEDTLGIGVAVGDTALLAFVNQYLEQRTEKLDIDKVLQALER